MKLKRDQISGLILIIFGIAAAIVVSGFSVPFTWQYPGPKAIPMLAVIGFIVCGAGIFIESTMSKKEEKAFLAGKGWSKLGGSVALLVLYLVLMNFIGFILSTLICLFLFVSYYARDAEQMPGIRNRVIFTVVFTLVVYVIYVYAFSLSLPDGMLFG